MIDHVEIGNADVVDLRDLRSFVTVARSASFTAAANELGYTQSAVSQHVASLEAAVGRRLLTRRPVRLTAAGQRLAEHAAHILLRVDVAQSELAMFADEPQQLCLTMTPLSAVGRVATALRAARAASPALRITITTTSATLAATSVAEGRADMAIVDGVVAPGNPLAVSDAGLLASFAVLEEDVAVIVPTSHPLRRHDVDLASLVDAQWIDAEMLTGGPSAVPGCIPNSDTLFTFAGVDVATLLELVAAGHGLALLPERVCAGNGAVRPIRVAHPILVHRTELLVLKTGVERHERFIASLRIAGSEQILRRAPGRSQRRS